MPGIEDLPIPDPNEVADILCALPKQVKSTVASDLSIDETVLLAESGFEPVGLIVGSSTFHVGFTGIYGMSQSTEITALSSAVHQARANAISQLVAHGRQLGGVGVVGVEIEIKPVHGHVVDFVAVGTAIKPSSGGSFYDSGGIGSVLQHLKKGGFFTSDLSGKDFLLLARAGYVPLGLAFGACVYLVGRQSLGSFFKNQTTNIELQLPTEAMYKARELAMSRMQSEAEHFGANGVVGTKIVESSHIWGSHVIEFLAFGTAVKLVSNEHHLAEPILTVPLDDPVIKTDPLKILGR